MDYKIFIIKILVLAFTFIIFLKINRKVKISKTIEKQLKLNTNFRAFTFCAVLYAVLTLITTLIQYFLDIHNMIIETIDTSILGFTIILFIQISKDVPMNNKN